MKLVFEISTAASLIVIAAWEWRQLARHPRDLPLRILASGVTCLALVVTLGISWQPFEVIDESLEVVHFSNFAWAFMIYCFAAFFLLVGYDGTVQSLALRKRKAIAEFCIYVVALTTMLVVSKTAPPGTWHTPRIPADYRTWQNIVFYLCVDGYAVVVWLVGVWRAIRYGKMIVHPWARLAISVVVVGTSAMVIGVDVISLIRQALYIVYPGSRWPVLSDMYNIGRLGGQVALAVGLGLAPLVALIPRAREQYDRILRSRYNRKLTPLWRLLMAEFPHLELLDGSRQLEGSREQAGFERKVVEITDGLAQLAIYISPDATRDGDTRDPQAAARTVAAGLEVLARNRRIRWAGGDTEPTQPPYPQIEPDFGSDWQSRARWMLQLGLELDRLPVAEGIREERRDVATGL